MDIIIFIVCLTFGLILTLLGLRSTPVSMLAIIFNTVFFAAASLPEAVNAQIYNGTALETVPYDVTPALVLPVAYVVMSIVKLWKYR